MKLRSYNIIYKDNDAFEILDAIYKSNFTNKDGSVNEKVLGLYVHHVGGDRVLSKDNKLLICRKIQEAEVIE